MFEGLSNIDPNMLSYFMGAAGKAISPEGTFGDVMGSAAMGMAGKKMTEADNQKRTNNFAKLLQGALAGGGKFSMDSEGFNLKAPHSAVQDQGGNPLDLGKMISMSMLGGLDGSGGSTVTPTTPATPQVGAPNTPGNSMGNALPFSSDSQADFLGSANLEGLTPEDISVALQLRDRVNNQGWDRLKDIENIKYMRAQTENMEQDNLRQWAQMMTPKEGTELQKNYKAYVDEATANKKKPMSFESFMATASNDSYKDYSIAKNEGYTGSYRQWLLELKKAGGTIVNIGERAFEQARGKQKADLYAPDHLSNIEKEIRAEIADEDKQVALTPNARLAKFKDKRSPEEVRAETAQRIRIRTIMKYTAELQSEFGKNDIKMIVKPGGSVEWWKRNSDGSGSLVKTY